MQSSGGFGHVVNTRNVSQHTELLYLLYKNEVLFRKFSTILELYSLVFKIYNKEMRE